MLAHSPSVVTDGLVFYYDMNNTQKSWKGAPTTNMYADGDFSSLALHPVRSGTWAIVDDPRNSAKKVVKAIPSAGNQYHGRDIVAVVSTVYSLQMEVFVSADFNGTNVQMYPEQGGSGANVAYNLANKGTWQTLKFNGKAATTINIRLLAYILSAFTTGYVLVSSVQVEQNSFATPFVNGTRSNTQAIIDLTGKNVITANSLTYNSDGTFGFNGSTNLMQVPNTVTGQGPMTLMAWVNGTGGMVISSGTLYGLFSEGVIRYWYWSSVSGGWINYSTNISVIPSNTWTYIVVTHAPGSASLPTFYANGVSYTSNGAGPTPTNSGDGGNVTIGEYSGYQPYSPYNGKIPNVQIYNRVLSASEVLQNFNALRGRYGI